jgi:hypothetical protein
MAAAIMSGHFDSFIQTAIWLFAGIA